MLAGSTVTAEFLQVVAQGWNVVGVGNYGQQGLGFGVMILDVKRVDEETSERGLDGEGNERLRIVVKMEVPDARSGEK